MKNVTITQNATVKAIGKVRNGNSKPVFCITTGMPYTSATDAAKEMGVSLAVLCLAASGKLRTCKKMRWCYLKDVMQHFDEIAENIRIREEKVVAYDKIVGKEKRKKELAEREAKYAAMQAKLEKEAEAIAAEKAALNEV